MIRRLYVHNFRCFENFDLSIAQHSSVLLIGKNGSGKSTVGLVLEILQRIARGTNRVGELLKPRDFTRGRADGPMRFEIDAQLGKTDYSYVLALELPQGFRELRVLEESLKVDGKPLYDREVAQVRLVGGQHQKEASFLIDWHLVALPVVQLKPQSSSEIEPLLAFKEWLSRLLVLRPIPSLITGDSTDEPNQPNPQVTNFGAWFSGLVVDEPSAYARVSSYLKQVMPDFVDIKNPATGQDARSLVLQFADHDATAHLPFGDLSDGEKCFLICAVVLATRKTFEHLVCFWDEPDNFLSLDEISHFVMTLRQAFQSGGQFLATSHSTEAIRRFSHENTILLHRRSHLEPTMARLLTELQFSGDVVEALTRGDLVP